MRNSVLGGEPLVYTHLPKAGGTMTGDLVLAGPPDADLKAATKAYVDSQVGGGGGSTVAVGFTILTNKGAGTTGQWGTEEATVADPGGAAEVIAWLIGMLLPGVADINAVDIELQISIDGGSTWSDSRTHSYHCSTVGEHASVAILHRVAGTPTGEVQARANVVLNDTTICAAGAIVMQVIS